MNDESNSKGFCENGGKSSAEIAHQFGRHRRRWPADSRAAAAVGWDLRLPGRKVHRSCSYCWRRTEAAPTAGSGQALEFAHRVTYTRHYFVYCAYSIFYNCHRAAPDDADGSAFTRKRLRPRVEVRPMPPRRQQP